MAFNTFAVGAQVIVIKTHYRPASIRPSKWLRIIAFKYLARLPWSVDQRKINAVLNAPRLSPVLPNYPDVMTYNQSQESPCDHDDVSMQTTSFTLQPNSITLDSFVTEERDTLTPRRDRKNNTRQFSDVSVASEGVEAQAEQVEMRTLPHVTRRHNHVNSRHRVLSSSSNHAAFNHVKRARRTRREQLLRHDVSNEAYNSRMMLHGDLLHLRHEQLTEWKLIAEILDRFFLYVFLLLFIVPTSLLLGSPKLFKPEL